MSHGMLAKSSWGAGFPVSGLRAESTREKFWSKYCFSDAIIVAVFYQIVARLFPNWGCIFSGICVNYGYQFAVQSS
jgi:hypothetical protein